MSSVVLPNNLNYAQVLPELPECQSYTQTINPVNGSTFQQNSQIIFDFPNRGFIDPKTIHFRYKIAVTSTTTAPQMISCPAYTPFVRLETLMGSQVVETINQYNQVAGHLLMNTTYDVAQKAGLQPCLGYAGANLTDPSTYANANIASMAKMDGRILSAVTGETFYLSAPLIGSLLTNCEKLLPMFCMPQVRVQLTLDSISNMFNTNTPSDVVLSNVELCYSLIDFGSAVENMVRSMGPKLSIKSSSFSNTSTNLASGTSGQVSLIFNQRYKSVKSAFILFSGTSANSLNKWGDSYDATSNNGDVQLFIGGVAYPQRPLSFINNKSGILQELRRAVGSMYDKTNQLSINTIEFNYKGNDTTTTTEPAKCIIGIELERLETKNAMLTGISTESSPITLQLNTNTATAQAHNVNCILNYDAIIELDVFSNQIIVKQ